MIENMQELTQAEDMAYFKADLCLYSPESYTLEEKRDICNEMISKRQRETRQAPKQSVPTEFATPSPRF